jgi:hypothetical protein
LAPPVLLLAFVASASAGTSVRTLASAASAPPGYVIEQSPSLPAPGGTYDSGGQVACPTGKVVWGGGVGIWSAINGDSINTSAAMGTTGWKARVNNEGTSPAQFYVDAICAKKPKLYRHVSHLVDDPAGMQAGGSATCPSGTVLLGGSVTSDGDTISEYLTSAWPSSSRKFTAYQENDTLSDQPFDVLALCAKKPKGYKIVTVSATAPAGPSGAGVSDGPFCPAGTSVLGGGVHVASPQPAVFPFYSTSGDASIAWYPEVFNDLATTVQFTGYAICAA